MIWKWKRPGGLIFELELAIKAERFDEWARERCLGIIVKASGGYIQQLKREGWYAGSVRFYLVWWSFFIGWGVRGDETWTKSPYIVAPLGILTEIWYPVPDTLLADTRFRRQNPEWAEKLAVQENAMVEESKERRDASRTV